MSTSINNRAKKILPIILSNTTRVQSINIFAHTAYRRPKPNLPTLLPRASKSSLWWGCAETLGGPYLRQVPLPRIPNNHESRLGTEPLPQITNYCEPSTAWPQPRLSIHPHGKSILSSPTKQKFLLPQWTIDTTRAQLNNYIAKGARLSATYIVCHTLVTASLEFSSRTTPFGTERSWRFQHLS